MYAEILLLRKLPKSIDFFDYQVPEKLKKQIKIGQVVNIPFRRQEVKGIVLNLKSKTTFKNIKKITEIVDKKELITENQLNLAKYTSKYYHVSLSTVIRQITPPLLKKPRKAKKIKTPFIKISSSKKISDISKKIFLSKDKKFVFKYLNHQKRVILYLDLIKKYFNKSKQVIILFPEIIDIENFYRHLPLKFRKITSVIHHRQAKSEIFHSFSCIKSGKTKIILGTPLSVFSPFKNLGLIIIDQEDSPNHKQFDQNPRFNAKTVAEKLSETNKNKLVLCSTAPNITTFIRINKNEFKLINLEEENKTNIQIVDLRQHGSTPLSLTLKNKIENIKKQNKKTLLFVNRKGFSSSLVCLDCSYNFICPDCQIPFTLHQKEKGFYLHCHRCNRQKEMPLSCPHCNSTKIKNIGVGTEKVQKEINKEFPELKTCLFEKSLKEKPDISGCDIIISTHLIFKKISWQDIGLVCIINADSLLYLPDYRSQEKTFQFLSRILSYLQINKQTEMIIQTYSPNNVSLKFFPSKYESFLRQELKLRKQFSYPPFSQLIKISSQNAKQYLAKENAQKIHDQLVKNNQSKFILISPVLPSFVIKRFNRYYYQIIIKKLPKAEENEIKKLINLVPDSFLIDVDPENLL